jgi:hypothetical protein
VNRPTDLGRTGERPNLFVIVGWLFVAVTVTLIILEKTT